MKQVETLAEAIQCLKDGTAVELVMDPQTPVTRSVRRQIKEPFETASSVKLKCKKNGKPVTVVLQPPTR